MTYQVGDQVQLTSIPIGRAKRLKVGLVGEVVCTNQGCGWVSVCFGAVQAYPFLLAPRHLALVSRAPAEVAG